MTKYVRTVLGDISADDLGQTDYHEHIFQVTPVLAGDELDDAERSTEEVRLLGASGFRALIDATPLALGRRPASVARASAETGVTVIATSGVQHEGHYAADHWVRGIDEESLAERLRLEVVAGQPEHDGPGGSAIARTPTGEPVRAGILKAGIGYWSISQFERRTLAAVASVHRSTGAPVMVHLERGSATHEVLDVLAADGVPADAVVLAHMDRNPDPGLHADLAVRGAYLGYDGFARFKEWPDGVLIDCMARAAEAGARDRVVMGGDVARSTRYAAYGGMPGLAYLGDRVLPRFAAEGLSELAHFATVTNPARLLGRFAAPFDHSTTAEEL